MVDNMNTIVYVILFLLYPRPLSSLPNGKVDAWMNTEFCTSSVSYRTLPWDCSGYLHCDNNHTHWTNCGPGLKYDAVSGKCESTSTNCGNPETAAVTYCSKYPFLKFVHPNSCAMYFDCSKTTPSPEYGFNIYESECKYPALFDHITMECRNQDSQNPVYCEDEPVRCDYVKECGPMLDCVGLSDGPHPDPLKMFLSDFIVCTGGKVTGRPSCDSSKNEIFHPLQRKCITKSETVLDDYCQSNPTARFANPQSCSMYFDCSVKQHHNVLRSYETECEYMDLYEVATKTCKRYNETSCRNRFEPKAPCEYRVSNCNSQGDCFQCSANCSGLPDGDNPYPGLPKTRFHLTCEDERTLRVSECTPPKIFLAGKKQCGLEGTDDTTEPDTSNRQECDTCGNQLDSFKADIGALFGEVDYVDKKVNEKLPDPFDCATPPSAENSILMMSHTPSSAVAEYKCDEGFIVCGNRPESVCTNQNQWSATEGSCVQNIWTEFKETAEPMNYNCPPIDELVVRLTGRYIGDVIVVTFANPANTTDIKMLLYINPKGNIAFGAPGDMHADNIQLILHNKHEWQIHFDKDNFKIHLNGQLIDGHGHRLDLGQNIVLNVVGGFKPERIEFHNKKRRNLFAFENGNLNLAYKRPVDVTSAVGEGGAAAAGAGAGADAESLTDGRNLAQWGSGSCWASTANDINPMLTIDLGKDFYISYLILTTANCTIDTCGSLHDIDIIIGRDSENGVREEYLCAKQTGVLPESQVMKIACKDDMFGRYVAIKRTSRLNDLDKMALCEVEVYGAPVSIHDFLASGPYWKPEDCPNPPLIPNAMVQIDYAFNKAIATYTCDKNYGTCSDTNVIHCYGPKGWDTQPQQCIQTTIEDNSPSGVDDFEVCPFSLGAGIELWLTPKADKSYLGLETGRYRSALSVEIQLQQDNASVIANDKVNIPSPFVKNTESHMTLTSVTGDIHIEIDGKPLMKGVTTSETAMGIRFLTKHPELHIRKAVIQRQMADVNRVDVTENENPSNLALKGTYASSSNYLNTPDIAFDNDLGTNYENGGCWHSAIGDKYPWIQVDLGRLYYIKNVELSLQNPCPGCGSINLALNKKAYGSTDVDSKSSPNYLVDGIRNANYDLESCFASSGPDAFWMVDLEASFHIKEIKLLGQTVAMDKFADFQVHVFVNNPETIVTAVPILCTQHPGAMTMDQILVCDTPAYGRYVRITKIDGSDPYLAMCEVEVYAVLYDRLHDFEVKVFETDPSSVRASSKLCYQQLGYFTGIQGSVHCPGDPSGRFIRVEGKNMNAADDLMTVCEMAVYGAMAEKKEWSPFHCPKPPLMSNAEVIVSYSLSRATATYMCQDDFSILCGSDVIYCEGVDGWDGKPSVCVKTNFISMEAAGLDIVVLPCKLRLGQAIEITYSSTNRGPAVVLKDIAEVFSFVTEFDKTVKHDGAKVILDKFTESRITVTFLTGKYDIASDGKHLDQINSNKVISKVEAKSPRMRTVRIVPASETLSMERSLTTNLAKPGLMVTSTSDASVSASRVVDGNLNRDDGVDPCWMAQVGDLKPSVLIMLDAHYYIERLIVSTRSDCTGECAERTHDILVQVFNDDPGTSEEEPQLCFYREGVIPTDTEETITCSSPVRGRFVRLEGLKRRNGNDLLTFCQVQIFGGEVILKRAAVIGKPKMRVDLCPTGYVSVESPRLCYYVVSVKRTYPEAKSLCNKNGRLLNLNSDVKKAYIFNVIENILKDDENVAPDYWIGGTKDCQQLTPAGISDIECTESRASICEILMEP